MRSVLVFPDPRTEVKVIAADLQFINTINIELLLGAS